MVTTELLPRKNRGTPFCRWYLHLVYPSNPEESGGVCSVLLENGLVLGRHPGPSPQLELVDAAVSRRHAQFRQENDDWWLEDLGSSNGTFVNGQMITRRRLEEQDVIRMGCSLMVVSQQPSVVEPELDEFGLITRTMEVVEGIRSIRRLIQRSRSALIMGESGTGKELVARLIHHITGRELFHAVNCATIPEGIAGATFFGARKGAYSGLDTDRDGLFLATDGGTLFLDEIGELSLTVQAKLLRVIEEATVCPLGSTEFLPVDVFLVAATNRLAILKEEDQMFRKDLLGRIEDTLVLLPPLRERRLDILPIAFSVLRSMEVPAQRISADFGEALLVNPWPRNVRQMVKTLQRVEALTTPGEPYAPENLGAVLVPVPPSTTQEGATTAESLNPEPGTTDPAPPEAPEVSTGPQNRSGPTDFPTVWGSYRGNVSEIARHYGVHRRQVYRWKSYFLKD